MQLPPKQYAQELIEKYYCIPDVIGLHIMQKYQAKQCALIDVQNTIKELMWTSLLINTDNPAKQMLNDKIEYFKEVETELQNS